MRSVAAFLRTSLALRQPGQFCSSLLDGGSSSPSRFTHHLIMTWMTCFLLQPWQPETALAALYFHFPYPKAFPAPAVRPFHFLEASRDLPPLPSTTFVHH